MRTIQRSLFGFLLLCAMTVQSVSAFPGWMGVYSYYQRHDGQNPGRFRILMNQSYVGLEANVGIKVDGGDWTEFPMNYVADVDGNSLWEYIPPQPFPFGSNVEFYFHGYDTDPANHIYDSRTASNYFSGTLFWGDHRVLPMYSVYPNNNLAPTAFACGGETLYLAFAFPGINTNLTFSRKYPGREWETFQMPGETATIGGHDLTADDTTVLAAYWIDTNIFVRTSPDDGNTWTEPVFLASVPASGSMAGLSAAAGGDGSFAVAYGIATNCCGAQNILVAVSTNTGLGWSTPSPAFQFHDVGAYANGFKLAGNQSGWFLAVREVYQGSSMIMLGGSSTNGSQWVTTHLGGDGNAWTDYDISATSNRVLIAADPYYSAMTMVWPSAPGGGWSTQKIDRVLESGSQIWLGNDLGNTFYLYRDEDNDTSPSAQTYLPAYRISVDGGNVWSYPQPVKFDYPGSNNMVSLKRVLGAAGPVQHLIWLHNDYVSMFQRMYSYWSQESSGFAETLAVSAREDGLLLIAATNLTAGMSHVLQSANSPDAGTWSDLSAWSHGDTNILVNPPSGITGVAYRIKSSY